MGSWYADYAVMFHGQMDEDEDVDFTLVFSEDSDGSHCQFSLWPETLATGSRS